MLVAQLRAVLDRIRCDPRGLDSFSASSLPNDVAGDDPLVRVAEDLVLDIIRTGQDGLVELDISSRPLFASSESRTKLSSVIDDSACLTDLTLPTGYPRLPSADRVLYDMQQHLRWNKCRTDRLLSLTTPPL